MKRRTLPVCVAALLSCGGLASAQDAPPGGGGPPTIPITELIDIVAGNVDERFIVDPRVRAEVTLIGQDPSTVDYAGLLAILQVHGYAAVRGADYVRVVPDSGVRSMSLPVARDGEDRPDAEYVTKVIRVRSVSAPALVPVLRPLMTQPGHLAAYSCGVNALVLVDTVANLGRIEELVASLDASGEPFEPPSCAPYGQQPTPQSEPGEAQPEQAEERSRRR